MGFRVTLLICKVEQRGRRQGSARTSARRQRDGVGFFHLAGVGALTVDAFLLARSPHASLSKPLGRVPLTEYSMGLIPFLGAQVFSAQAADVSRLLFKFKTGGRVAL